MKWKRMKNYLFVTNFDVLLEMHINVNCIILTEVALFVYILVFYLCTNIYTTHQSSPFLLQNAIYH